MGGWDSPAKATGLGGGSRWVITLSQVLLGTPEIRTMWLGVGFWGAEMYLPPLLGLGTPSSFDFFSFSWRAGNVMECDYFFLLRPRTSFT